jgi:hypothetical protein
MPSKRSLFLLMLGLAAAVPALAVPDPPVDELERNRRLLDSWRTDPEHYARLRRDFKEFWELADDQRERLRRLDRELRATDARTQRRLLGVMERYASWLERLPEGDRQQIASADRSERLAVVRAIRDRQYFESLPAKVREELALLPAVERRAQLDRLRGEDRRLRLACVRIAQSRPDPQPAKPPSPTATRPTRLAEFTPDVRYYVENVLWRQIKPEEAEQLKKAEGAAWPVLARTILELSDKHPVRLPGPVTGPRRYIDLPAEVLKAMSAKDLLASQRKHLNEQIGKWPEFAAEYSALARKNGVNLPRQLGPCHPTQFDAPVAQFIDRALLPKLTQPENEQLRAAEGKWPDYPRLLLELAKKHGLEVPLMHLPGPRELWDQARAG